MKKLISFFLIVAMVASFAVIGVNAAGSILMQDNFSTFFDDSESGLNPANWITDGNLFVVEDGWCKGYHEAVVNQSEYREEMNGNKCWSECSVAVDIAFFDFDSDGDDHKANLWWRDYVIDTEIDEVIDEESPIYELCFCIEARQVRLTSSLVEDGPIAVYDIPASFGEIKVDTNNPTIINLGMRIQQNKIYGYLNGEKVIDYTAPRTLGAQRPSPVLLVNGGMYIGFDNFTVATVDYPLFAADTAAPVDTDNNVGGNDPAPNEPKETEIVTKIETDTDTYGNTVTKVVSEVVTKAPADTNTNGTAGGTGAQTGDMAVIVAAVMIIALGSAIVVKKTTAK